MSAVLQLLLSARLCMGDIDVCSRSVLSVTVVSSYCESYRGRGCPVLHSGPASRAGLSHGRVSDISYLNEKTTCKESRANAFN